MKSILKGVDTRKLKACPQDYNPLGLYGCDCYNYYIRVCAKSHCLCCFAIFFLSTNQMLTDNNNNNNNNNNNKDNKYKDFINWI